MNYDVKMQFFIFKVRKKAVNQLNMITRKNGNKIVYV